MPNGIRNREGSNFEAICLGLTPVGRKFYKLHFIVPISYNPSVFEIDECKFKQARYTGTREQCERNLIDYPNCKII